jgi:hypothetical protein
MCGKKNEAEHDIHIESSTYWGDYRSANILTLQFSVLKIGHVQLTR